LSVAGSMACSSTQMIFMLVSCASSGDCRLIEGVADDWLVSRWP
jgi:hypothetical protein